LGAAGLVDVDGVGDADVAGSDVDGSASGVTEVDGSAFGVADAAGAEGAGAAVSEPPEPQPALTPSATPAVARYVRIFRITTSRYPDL
jgi:hypothetical protein